MITLTVNGKQVKVATGATIMQACKTLNIEVPRFCYHERLSIAGNCRMCMVEVEGFPKPVSSCSWPASEGMKVRTKSQVAIDAQKGGMEFLLINHPLDCPVCDQAGECDLQDISVSYGSDTCKYKEQRRQVPNMNLGPLVKTVMTRCIHCTRCVRFATEIAGIEEIGGTFRGENKQIGTYIEHTLESELSGNMIDLCPVGALTNKPYAFTARAWELSHTASIDVMDAVGSHITLDTKNNKVMRIRPRECEGINQEWLSDTSRFAWTGLTENRLTSPMVKSGKSLRDTSWSKAFEKIKKAIKGVKRDRIAGLASSLHSAEDYYAFNTFMKGVVGTDNIDGRGGITLTKADNRSNYIMNSTIEGIEEADVILLVGCNPRLEAPLVNTRIRSAMKKNNAVVALIGEPCDLTYPTLELGKTTKELEALKTGKSTFSKVLKNAQKPVIIVGAKAVLTRGDAKPIMATLAAISAKYGVVNKKWNGFNVLQQSVGAVASLDMETYPVSGGMDSKAIVKALKDDKIDVLFIYGDVRVPTEKLIGAKTTIFIGTHKSDYAKMANIVLPSTVYTEKFGWWVNTEGLVQEGIPAVLPPNEAKEDWKIFRAMSEVMGKKLPFDDLSQLRGLVAKVGGEAYSEIGKLIVNKYIPVVSKSKLKTTAFVNPVTAFYGSNEILRSSKVMEECQVLANKRRQPKLKRAS